MKRRRTTRYVYRAPQRVSHRPLHAHGGLRDELTLGFLLVGSLAFLFFVASLAFSR